MPLLSCAEIREELLQIEQDLEPPNPLVDRGRWEERRDTLLRWRHDLTVQLAEQEAHV